jgi:catechol 2,3-dioxygenase-like lactoylglutathione lyase family enzyme
MASGDGSHSSAPSGVMGPSLPPVIQHVALETRREDGEAAAAFWRVLGFEDVEPPESLRERAAWLQRGGTPVHLLWSDAPVAPPEGHPAVVVNDYDQVVERLREAGFTVEPRTEHWGAPRCFVHDPAGHRVEVMAAPPPGSD